MLEESGRVVSVDPDGVWVETVKQSACGGCSARNGCGQALLASVGDGKRSVICVDNPQSLCVKENDQVVIGVAEQAFMHMSVLMYLVPLITLFIAAVLAGLLALSEPGVIGVSVLGFVAGLLLVRYVSRTLLTSCRYHPVLLKVQ